MEKVFVKGVVLTNPTEYGFQLSFLYTFSITQFYYYECVYSKLQF